MSPTLPNELLLEIFDLLSDDSEIPLTISSVCSQWRQVAFAMPSLWRNLLLPADSCDLSMLQVKAELWVRNSNPGVLNVIIKYDRFGSERVLPLLSWVSPASRRLGKFQIIGDRSFEIKNFPRIFRLTVFPVNDGEWCRWSAGVDAPGIGINFTVNSVQSITSVAPIHNLRNIVIDVPNSAWGVPGNPHFHEMLGFLGSCPGMETLAINIPELVNATFPKCRHSCTYPSVVTLPNLTSLKIKSPYVRCILLPLSAPKLVVARIHLFGKEEFGWGEKIAKGALADTPTFSSHNMGASLRSLFATPTPPTEILILDGVFDMQNDDYAWIASHFMHLKELRIVRCPLSDRALLSFSPNDSSPPLPKLSRLIISTELMLSKLHWLPSEHAVLNLVTSREVAAEKGQAVALDVLKVHLPCITKDFEELLAPIIPRRRWEFIPLGPWDE